MNRKNVGPNKAEKRIFFIILINLGLHPGAMLAIDFISYIVFSTSSEFEKYKVLYKISPLSLPFPPQTTALYS